MYALSPLDMCIIYCEYQLLGNNLVTKRLNIWTLSLFFVADKDLNK